MTSHAREAGFTLLEVLVALVILGLTVAFLAGTISGSLARGERIDTEDRAAALADTILDGLGRDITINVGATAGTSGNLVWHLVIVPYKEVSSVVPIDQVHLAISSQSGHIIGQWETLRIQSTVVRP